MYIYIICICLYILVSVSMYVYMYHLFEIATHSKMELEQNCDIQRCKWSWNMLELRPRTDPARFST